MARGSVAKTQVQNKIALAFGNDYIGEVDKKLYVWANDGGERVQIAIAMTCPKNPVDVPGVSTTEDHTDFNWDDDNVTVEIPKPAAKAEVTEEETRRIADMMEKLGL